MECDLVGNRVLGYNERRPLFKIKEAIEKDSDRVPTLSQIKEVNTSSYKCNKTTFKMMNEFNKTNNMKDMILVYLSQDYQKESQNRI